LVRVRVRVREYVRDVEEGAGIVDKRKIADQDESDEPVVNNLLLHRYPDCLQFFIMMAQVLNELCQKSQED